MKKLLSAWLALALSAAPVLGAEQVRAVERVSLEAPMAAPRGPELSASLASSVIAPDAGPVAAPPSLPDSAVLAPEAGPMAVVPNFNARAVNDNFAAPDDSKPASAPATELDSAAGALKFDGVKAAPQWRSVALAIMAAGSFNLSRTNTVGRKWFAPRHMTNEQVRSRAERNFRKAAVLVVDHAKELPVSKATAIRLNKILTEGLVPEEIRGDPNFHRDTNQFYAWLAGPEAAKLSHDDPVEFAQQLHYKLSRNDSFADGNGRLARLMADLALVRANLAPVYYTDMKDYFERGNHRSKVSSEARRAYFREMAARGQRAVRDPAGFKAGLGKISGIDPATYKAVTGNEGHAGTAAFSRKQN